MLQVWTWGVEESPARHVSAPKHIPNTEKFKCGRAVRMRAQNVRASANGGSEYSKSIACGLCCDLDASVEYSFQLVVERSLNPSKLKFSNNDDMPITTAVYKETLEKLLPKIGKNFATATLGVHEQRCLHLQKRNRRTISAASRNVSRSCANLAQSLSIITWGTRYAEFCNDIA